MRKCLIALSIKVFDIDKSSKANAGQLLPLASCLLPLALCVAL
ncbi:hypothetical protein [Moorena sp. SIO3H5]|nr:hypothetical protein [Moorena sp. SIO3H5]